MNNRYAAPKTPVADASAFVEPRPKSVTIALVLVALLVLVECYHQVARLAEVNNGEISGLSWLIDWLWVGVVVVTGIMLARGRGWARWILVLITLYQLYALADGLLFLSSFDSGMSDFVDPISLAVFPMASLFSVGAVILVFGPGRGWFWPRN